MKILRLTVSRADFIHTWEVGANCEKISGPYEDRCNNSFWKVEEKDAMIWEYFVYSVEYKKEKGE